jgi:hypothetical protein
MKHVPLALVAVAVSLTLAAALSTAGCLRTAAPVSRAGQVSAARGRASVAVGEACSVDVAAESRQNLNCRVSIRCGARALFGGPLLGGYAECGVTKGRYSSASDPMPSARDGDPMLELDLARRFARVSDRGYDVEIALAER